MKSCFCGLQGLRRSQPKAATIAILGLDNAGKTTIVSCLSGSPDDSTAPSIGFSTESISHGNFKLQVYDVGGGKNIRRIWRTYYADLHGFIYVVDASDPCRFEEARTVLAQAVADAYLSTKPLLVLANKQDMPGAAPAHEIAAALGLTQLRDIQYNIMACTAKCSSSLTIDPAISTGLRWLLGTIEAQYPKLTLRVAEESQQASHTRWQHMCGLQAPMCRPPHVYATVCL